jgi:hypothetical protein
MEHESIPRPPGINEAMNEITMIEQRIMQGGSTDVEPNMLARVRQELAAGEISPTEAIARARSVETGRQDYH